jgi:hypothetical protein
MAVTVQRQFESVVTEISQDAFVGSSIEHGTTVLQFDLRRHNVQQELGTQATLCWRKESSHVDEHARSTFHHPLLSRFLLAQGSSLNDQKPRIDCTPALKGVATSQPRSHSVIRLSCSLAVVCRVSLRHVAVLVAARFLMPSTKSSSKRWMDDMGSNVPTPEARRRQLLALAPATACHMDGSSPLGTDHGVMVVQDEHDRILMTPEAASEHGEDARQCLQRCKALGLQVTAACSDDSPSFTEAIKAVYPQARWQADHCHTVKHSWGHLKQALLSYRSKVKASGEAPQQEASMALAKK